MANTSYTYKKLDAPEGELEFELHQTSSRDCAPHPRAQLTPKKDFFSRVFLAFPRTVIAISIAMFVTGLTLALVAVTQSVVLEPRAVSTTSTPDVPQYFQTTPEIFAGGPLPLLL